MYIFVIFPNGPFILMMVIITETLQIHSLKLVKKQCCWAQGCSPCKLNLALHILLYLAELSGWFAIVNTISTTTNNTVQSNLTDLLFVSSREPLPSLALQGFKNKAVPFARSTDAEQ